MFGRHFPIPLVHGEFKKRPNNPSIDGTTFLYCPPEQVDSEMNNLIALYHSEMKDAHVIAKAAWLHHAFVTIHPFQDGNGRVARLLASLVLIQDNLFPLTVERTNRKQYIDALEQADVGNYQVFADVITNDQIISMKIMSGIPVYADDGYIYNFTFFNGKPVPIQLIQGVWNAEKNRIEC